MQCRFEDSKRGTRWAPMVGEQRTGEREREREAERVEGRLLPLSSVTTTATAKGQLGRTCNKSTHEHDTRSSQTSRNVNRRGKRELSTYIQDSHIPHVLYKLRTCQL